MRTVLILLCAATAFAETPLQQMKARGLATDVKLDDLAKTKFDAQKFTARGAVFERHRCGNPEFPDKEISEATVAKLVKTLSIDEEYAQFLKDEMSRMLEDSTGRGSWPPGCHDEYPNRHAAKYFIEKNKFPSAFNRPVTNAEWQEFVDAKVWGVTTVAEAKAKFDKGSYLETGLALFEETYRQVGLAYIRTNNRSEADVLITGRRIEGSIIGYAYFNSKQCGRQVLQVLDISYRPKLGFWTSLVAHEGGHNARLEHQFDNQNYHRSIMSYRDPHGGIYRGFADGSQPGIPRDPARTVLARFFSSDPIPTEDPPTVPDPPVDPPTDPTDSGKVHLKVGDEITQQIGDAVVIMEIKQLMGVTPPDLGAKLKALIAAISYEKKEIHQRILSIIYNAVLEGVKADKITIADGLTRAKQLREGLLLTDVQAWGAVFQVIDGAESIEHLQQIANAFGQEFGPVIEKLIQLVIELLPDDSKIKKIIEIILTLIGGLEAETVVIEPEGKPIEPGIKYPTKEPSLDDLGVLPVSPLLMASILTAEETPEENAPPRVRDLGEANLPDRPIYRRHFRRLNRIRKR